MRRLVRGQLCHAAEYLQEFTDTEGVLFIGKAQEKTPVFWTERRRNEKTAVTYPWLVRSTAASVTRHLLSVGLVAQTATLSPLRGTTTNAVLTAINQWRLKQVAADGTPRFATTDALLKAQMLTILRSVVRTDRFSAIGYHVIGIGGAECKRHSPASAQGRRYLHQGKFSTATRS